MKWEGRIQKDEVRSGKGEFRRMNLEVRSTKLKVESWKWGVRGVRGVRGVWRAGSYLTKNVFKLNKLRSHETVESEVKVRTFCPAGKSKVVDICEQQQNSKIL